MSIPSDLADLAPYVSFTVAEIDGRKGPKGIAVHLKSLAKKADHRGKFSAVRSDGGVGVAWFHYTETRKPSWMAAGSDLSAVDTLQRLVLVYLAKGLAAIYCAENGFAGEILGSFGDKGSPLKQIPAETLEGNLARGEAKTLWLGSVQRRSGQRADSKVLAGQDLALALDPLEDQGYAVSSVRCDHGSSGSPEVVGVSPSRSRIWRGPTSDINSFVEAAGKLLARAAGAAPATASFTALLATRAMTRDVTHAFEVVILHPDLDIGAESIAEDEAALRREWAELRELNVTGGPSDEFTLNVSDLNCTLKGALVGERVEFVCSGGHVGQDGPCSEALEVLSDGRRATVRYGSGHTWMNGEFYEMRLRPASFEPVFAEIDPAKIDVTEEKPRRLAGNGKKLKDGTPARSSALATELLSKNAPSEKATKRSLFNWVAFCRPPEVLPKGGWLACDDGSGEKADFVHLDPGSRVVSLIHVKAQHSSGNGVALTDFELVVAQAIKNIRWLEVTDLAAAVQSPAPGLKDLVWRSGSAFKTSDDRRALFGAELKNLGSNYRRRVVVVQPALSETAWATEKKKPKPYAAQLLSTLLVTAESQCRGIGADFVVVGRRSKSEKDGAGLAA